MAKNKTIETEASVFEFLETIKDEKRRNDCSGIIDLITEHSGLEPKMWGPNIIGFGSYHYKYDSGHEGDAPLVGIASRTTAIVFYLSANFEERDVLLQSLGKHKTEKSCVYIKGLEDIDTAVLIKIVKNHIRYIQKLYPN
jgi:hypothetical protein